VFLLRVDLSAVIFVWLNGATFRLVDIVSTDNVFTCCDGVSHR
jgi:hypothetical protein